MFPLLVLAAALTTSDPPPPLALADAIAQARSSSPMRSSSENLANGSTEAARLAGRILNPLFDVRVENLSGEPSLQRDVFAVVGQPIELGGKRQLRAGIANADRDLALAGLRSTDAQISLRTAQLYVNALKARGLLEAQTAIRDGLDALIVTLRRRVEEGYAPEADLLKFETESARMDIEMARARLDLERSLSALTYLIGATVPVVASQLVEPMTVAAPTVDATSITTMIAGHPEVVAAGARAQRAGQVAALEHARRLPDLLVSVGYKRTSGFDTAVAGVSLNLPLFERNASAAAKALGEERAAAAEREALKGRLASDAAALVLTAQALAGRSARVDAELLAPADAVRNAALASFQEGRSDVLRLLDAERVYGEVRRTILELRLDALVAALEARFALGQEMLP